MADEEKIKITPKGPLVSSKVEQMAKEFEAARKSLLDSPAMRAIEESSRSFEASITPLVRQLTATSASLGVNSEALRALRIAEESMAGFESLSSTAKSLSLDFPATHAAARQFAEMYRNPFQGELDKIISAARMDAVRNAAEAIHFPWIKAQSALASIQGLAGLSSIGQVLQKASHPFEHDVTGLIRDQFGDWRHTAISTMATQDPMQRSAFYVEQGLNPLLIDYPTRAFDDALNSTSIRPRKLRPAIPAYLLPTETDANTDAPPAHMVEAYEVIFSFESRMRKFIDEKMSERFGANWVKHRAPNNIKKDWVDKKTKACDYGESEYPLICYADFTHYEPIIVRSDNWDEVFKFVFRNKESVIESFRRLYPFRLSTMHSRVFLSEDKLYLIAETRRLLKAIEDA